ncbi:MAG: MurR/RpiR family transcriptional regulator [Planctomycetota bacterium]
MSISDLIANAAERLTPTERRIAAKLLAEPSLLAFGTVSDVAAKVGTSRPSIVRFASKLGFSGYSEFQDHFRDGVSKQLSRPSQRIRHQDQSLMPARLAVESAIATVLETIDQAKLEKLAKPIVAAKNVWIISGETSQAGAHALQSGLGIIRRDVRLVREHSSARDLSQAAPGDVLVVIDFARYRRHVVHAAKALADYGVDLVAITDGPLSPLAALTENWCGLSVPAIGPFDSSLPAVATAELLVAHVATHLRDSARERIDRTEALWKATDTFIS